MDIDERVTPELAGEITAAIRDRSKDGYRFRRLNFFLHREMCGGGMQRWNLIHLARRDKFRFGGKMHETTLLAAPMERVGQLQAFMWHLGDSVYAERLRKNTTYMEILVEELLRRNEKIHWHDLLIRPIADFFKNYVVRQGWRDGVLGLIWALHCTSGLV